MTFTRHHAPTTHLPRRAHTPSRRASAMIAVIIVLVILQFAVIGVVIASARDQDVSGHRLSAAQSLYAAEGVAHMALREIDSGVDEDGDGGIGSISAPSGMADVSIGGATASAAITTAGSTTTVNVTGTAAAAHRDIQMSVSRTLAAPGVVQGLYTETWVRPSSIAQLSDIPWTSAPSAVAVVGNVDMPVLSSAARWSGGPTSRYGLRLTGKINIPTSGNWTFTLNSDDGAALYINGTLVVNNDGVHAATNASGIISLSAGQASFQVLYFENSGSASVLQASWSGPGVPTTTIIPTSVFTCDPVQVMPAIAADSTITVTGDSANTTAYIDAFDSTRGKYGGSNVYTNRATVSTNSTSSGAFAMSKKATLKGNALVGPGGSVGTVISLSTAATITGTSSVSPVRFVALLGKVPAGAPSSEGNIVFGSSQTISSTTRRFNNLTIQTKNTTVTINGSVVWIIDGDLTMSNRSYINLSPGAKLTIYCSGSMTFQNNCRVNTNTGIPSSLCIVMLGSSETVNINGTAQICANISNPFGGLSLVGSRTSHFYGRYAGNSLSVNVRSRIHADVPTISASGGASTVTEVQGWTYVP